MRLQLGSSISSQPQNSSRLVCYENVGTSSTDRPRPLPPVGRSSLGINPMNSLNADHNSLINEGFVNPCIGSIYTFGASNSVGIGSQFGGDTTVPDDMACGLYSKIPLETKPPRLISNLDSGVPDFSYSRPRQSSILEFSQNKSPQIDGIDEFGEQQKQENSLIAMSSRKQSRNYHDSLYGHGGEQSEPRSNPGLIARSQEYGGAPGTQQQDEWSFDWPDLTSEYDRHINPLQ